VLIPESLLSRRTQKIFKSLTYFEENQTPKVKKNVEKYARFKKENCPEAKIREDGGSRSTRAKKFAGPPSQWKKLGMGAWLSAQLSESVK
jgi:hypothetical protein